MDFIRNMAIIFIRVFQFTLFARAIMSWFPMSNNAIVSFLYNVTEPLLSPVRKLLFKIPALQRIPIDFSIIAVFLLLDILRILVITS